MSLDNRFALHSQPPHSRAPCQRITTRRNDLAGAALPLALLRLALVRRRSLAPARLCRSGLHLKRALADQSLPCRQPRELRERRHYQTAPVVLQAAAPVAVAVCLLPRLPSPQPRASLPGSWGLLRPQTRASGFWRFASRCLSSFVQARPANQSEPPSKPE